jgi:uncharacterized protein
MSGTPGLDIEEEVTGSKGRYVAKAGNGGEDAVLSYSTLNATTIIIDSTVVPDAWRGKGAGKALVGRAVTDARERGIRIVPLCPFAKAQIERHPEWRDVLA